MAKKLFNMPGGFTDGSIYYLSGAGAPGGDTSYQDEAPVGSVYTDTGSGVSYVKVTAGSGTDKWGVQASSENVSKRVTQAAHGLTVGQLVQFEAGTGYTLAQADVGDNADVVGIINEVVDVNTLVIVGFGWSAVDASAYTDGEALFLDQTTAGAFTNVKPHTGIQKNIGYVVEGKVYLDSDMAIDISDGDGPEVPFIIQEAITTTTVVDSDLVDNIDSAFWHIVATKVDGSREALTITATHDGTDVADATEAEFSEYGIVNVGPTTISGLSFGLALSGVGAAQEMQLVVASTDQVDVKVRRLFA